MIITHELLALLVGVPVVDDSGGSLGKVVDVYESPEALDASFVRVQAGTLLGKTHLLPIADAEIVDHEMRVPYSRESIRAAPKPEVDETFSASDERTLRAYYRRLGENKLDGSDSACPPAKRNDLVQVSVTVSVIPEAMHPESVPTATALLEGGDALQEVAAELARDSIEELVRDPRVPSTTMLGEFSSGAMEGVPVEKEL